MKPKSPLAAATVVTCVAGKASAPTLTLTLSSRRWRDLCSAELSLMSFAAATELQQLQAEAWAAVAPVDDNMAGAGVAVTDIQHYRWPVAAYINQRRNRNHDRERDRGGKTNRLPPPPPQFQESPLSGLTIMNTPTSTPRESIGNNRSQESVVCQPHTQPAQTGVAREGEKKTQGKLKGKGKRKGQGQGIKERLCVCGPEPPRVVNTAAVTAAAAVTAVTAAAVVTAAVAPVSFSVVEQLQPKPQPQLGNRRQLPVIFKSAVPVPAAAADVMAVAPSSSISSSSISSIPNNDISRQPQPQQSGHIDNTPSDHDPSSSVSSSSSSRTSPQELLDAMVLARKHGYSDLSLRCLSQLGEVVAGSAAQQNESGVSAGVGDGGDGRGPTVFVKDVSSLIEEVVAVSKSNLLVEDVQLCAMNVCKTVLSGQGLGHGQGQGQGRQVVTASSGTGGADMSSTLGNCGVCELAVLVLVSHSQQSPSDPSRISGQEEAEVVVSPSVTVTTACMDTLLLLADDNPPNKLRIGQAITPSVCELLLLGCQQEKRQEQGQGQGQGQEQLERRDESSSSQVLLTRMLKLVSVLCKDAPANQSSLGSSGVIEKLVDMLDDDDSSESVLYAVSATISNLCSQRHDDNRTNFASVRCCRIYVNLLRRVMVTNKRCSPNLFSRLCSMLIGIFGRQVALKNNFLDTDLIQVVYDILAELVSRNNSDGSSSSSSSSSADDIYMQDCIQLLLNFGVVHSFFSKFDNVKYLQINKIILEKATSVNILRGVKLLNKCCLNTI